MTTLDQVAGGEPVRVVRLNATGGERIRLLDLGFVPGTVVQRLQTSPLGDPAAFAVRSTVIALRREQSQNIEVEPCPR